MSLPEPLTLANEYTLGVDLGQNAAMSAASAYFTDGRLEAGGNLSRNFPTLRNADALTRWAICISAWSDAVNFYKRAVGFRHWGIAPGMSE